MWFRRRPPPPPPPPEPPYEVPSYYQETPLLKHLTEPQRRDLCVGEAFNVRGKSGCLYRVRIPHMMWDNNTSATMSDLQEHDLLTQDAMGRYFGSPIELGDGIEICTTVPQVFSALDRAFGQKLLIEADDKRFISMGCLRLRRANHFLVPSDYGGKI